MMIVACGASINNQTALNHPNQWQNYTANKNAKYITQILYSNN